VKNHSAYGKNDYLNRGDLSASIFENSLFIYFSFVEIIFANINYIIYSIVIIKILLSA